MKPKLAEFLSCPECASSLQVKDEIFERGEIKKGLLFCQNGHTYEIINFIPRFIKDDKYSASFSYEWNRFSETQLDSKSGINLSERQFQERIDFPLNQIRGKLVFDAGCGMGRYSEIINKFGGIVVGMDLSYSVDAAFRNIGFEKNVHIIQGDIFKPPFKREIFDFIYSYGVLHHTPDAHEGFRSLTKFLKKEGKFSLFVYDSYEKVIVYSSNFWRKITVRLPRKLLYYFCFISVPLYYIYKVPVIGHFLKGIFVISMWPYWRMRWLDTFDWYSPKFQSKHTHAEVFQWFQQAGFKDIKIFKNGVTMQGTKI